MEWEEIVKDPSLKDLPFKIETNEWGKIIMAPASYAHGVYQSSIDKTLGGLAKEGVTSTECAIQTSKGVRVGLTSHGEARHSTKNMEYASLNSLNPRKSLLQ